MLDPLDLPPSGLEVEIQKLVEGYKGMAKQASQMEVCDMCRSILSTLKVKVETICEYCGMQLLTGNRVVRYHFDPHNFDIVAEEHTPELCKSIRNGALTCSPNNTYGMSEEEIAALNVFDCEMIKRLEN